MHKNYLLKVSMISLVMSVYFISLMPKKLGHHLMLMKYQLLISCQWNNGHFFNVLFLLCRKSFLKLKSFLSNFNCQVEDKYVF